MGGKGRKRRKEGRKGGREGKKGRKRKQIYMIKCAQLARVRLHWENGSDAGQRSAVCRSELGCSGNLLGQSTPFFTGPQAGMAALKEPEAFT